MRLKAEEEAKEAARIEREKQLAAEAAAAALAKK